MATTGAQLPPLTLKIQGDIKGLQASFNQAGALTKKFASGFSAPMKEARVAVAAFSNTMMGFAAPVAAAATAWASFSSIMGAFERAETLSKTAAGLGVTVDALDKLNYAASLSSSSAAELEGALRKMNVFLGTAAEDGSKAGETLDALGLSVSDFAGMSSDEAFLKLADALKGVGSQGEKAKIGAEIFGKGANKMAAFAGQGSAAIKALGDEGERFGRTLSALDVAKMGIAKDSIEKMQTAFTSLADRAAVALSPLFDFVTQAINDWIGDTREFESTFNSMAKGVVAAIGTIKMVWQGLQLLWEGGKAVIYTIGEIFADVARGITKAALWIGAVAGGAWDELRARFDVVAKALYAGWIWIKTSALEAFSEIGVAFGGLIRSMGEAAAASRIKGLADIGRSAQEAGGAMIVGAAKLKQGTQEEMAAASSALGASMSALNKVREDFARTPIDTATPYLDAVSDGYKKLAIQSVETMREMSRNILSQEGGNAISDMLAGYEKKLKEFNDKAKAAASEQADNRTAVIREGYSKEEQYLMDSEKRKEDAAFASWKRFVDAGERKIKKQSEWDELNATLIREQDAAEIERDKTKVARMDAAHKAIVERRIKAEEELSILAVEKETERGARIAEVRAQYAREDEDSHNTIIAQWEAGARGKADVMSNFFGQMSALMESRNKKMFEVGKAAAIAGAIVDTYRGAQSAFTAFAGQAAMEANPAMLAAGIAAAGAAVVAGMARVASIRSTTIGGGGGGAGGGGSAGMATGGGGSDLPGRGNGNAESLAGSPSAVNISLHGSSFSAEQVRGMIAALNDARGDNMNIYTVAQ